MAQQPTTADRARSIVVVEDDVSMSQAMERILRLAGFEPFTFASAEALLERGAPSDAACLVFDVHLPGLTGFELHERLALAGATPPVIFITAYDEPETRAHAEKAGAVAYLGKPFGGRMLIETIRRALAVQQE